MTRGHAEAGFSLIEALIAMAVLAVSAISILAAAQAHVTRVAGLETRVLARIVAENRLNELEAGAPIDDAPVEMLGQPFGIAVARTPTADPDLDRLDFTVLDALGAQVLAGFVGFLAKPVAQ